MNCSACDHESSSKKNRSKGSSCEDCYADNSVVDWKYDTNPCSCSAVGHDKSKLKKMPDIEESLFDDIKTTITAEKKQSENVSYKILQLEKLKDETDSDVEIEVIERQIKKLREGVRE